MIRQGEIYWIDFGAAAGSAPAQRHLCVVVQNDLFNRSRIMTAVVCLITSNLTRAEAPGNVLLEEGEGNLKRASVVNVSQVVTVDKAELSERVGRLPSGKVDAIRRGLHLLSDRV